MWINICFDTHFDPNKILVRKYSTRPYRHTSTGDQCAGIFCQNKRKHPLVKHTLECVKKSRKLYALLFLLICLYLLFSGSNIIHTKKITHKASKRYLSTYRAYVGLSEIKKKNLTCHEALFIHLSICV